MQMLFWDFFSFFETGSHCVGQASLVLAMQPRLASNSILLPAPPKRWDHEFATMPSLFWSFLQTIFELQQIHFILANFRGRVHRLSLLAQEVRF
jgi:hypothetical protein